MCVSVTTAHVTLCTSRPRHNQDRLFLVIRGIFLPVSLPFPSPPPLLAFPPARDWADWADWAQLPSSPHRLLSRDPQPQRGPTGGWGEEGLGVAV